MRFAMVLRPLCQLEFHRIRAKTDIANVKQNLAADWIPAGA